MNENNINQIPPEPQICIDKLNPFGKFCVTIGMLPSSYKDSMTYEEQLLWFCNYLQNTVIPAVNQNAEATKELQELYTQLKNYVDNYFTNLNVQSEINTKLDEMAQDGTLYNIINNDIFNDINNNILQNSINISANTKKIDNAITKDSTNVITSAMLTQEVKEEITGGTVAVVGENSITASNIQNNAIDILNLKEDLQDNFIKYYENIDFSTNLSGYPKINAQKEIEIQQDINYLYGIINLSKDIIYNFTGYNYYYINGLIIVDNDTNKVIYNSRNNTTDSPIPFSLIFRANKNNLVAYITKQSENYANYNKYLSDTTTISKITDILLNKQKTKNIEELTVIDQMWVGAGSQIGKIPTTYNSNLPTTSKIHIYKLSKGVKYKCSSFNYSYIVGLCLLNENLEISYKSSNASSDYVPFNYEFVASDNGYALLSDYNEYTSSLELYHEKDNNYLNKNWCCVGDSLTAISTLGENVKNYTNYVAEKLNLNVTNVAHGGSGYVAGGSTGNLQFYNQANDIPINSDIVTIFGSFNDLYVNIPIGNWDDSDETSLCGCINKTLDNIINKVPNALLGVILPTPWEKFYADKKLNDNAFINPLDYVNAIKKICNYRSIPILNLYFKSNLRPWEESFRAKYYKDVTDGNHPNTYGHQRISPEICEFIKSIL